MFMARITSEGSLIVAVTHSAKRVGTWSKVRIQPHDGAAHDHEHDDAGRDAGLDQAVVEARPGQVAVEKALAASA